MTARLKSTATRVRQDVIRMQQRGTGVGSALSCVDILVTLYFDVMHIEAPDDPARDRFILSKGHAASALYAVLAHKGFFDRALLDGFLEDQSALTGHPERNALPGIELSTGSLGHGLPTGVGMALAAKWDGDPHRVFVLLGDGELQEGTVWEGAMLASALQCDNLVAIVDANRWQGYGRVDDLTPIDAFAEKWRAFGWAAETVDGHDFAALAGALRHVPFTVGKPSAVIANTIKGRGVGEMEDTLGWHYFSVPSERVADYCHEVQGGNDGTPTAADGGSAS